MESKVATAIRPADAAAIEDAAALLAVGRLVAFPTETVYGLGGNALDARAVAAVFAAKGRPQFNPLIVHVADLAEAAKLAQISPMAERLARIFWPGALTLVLPRKANTALSLLACAGLDTVAIRAPAHPIARRLLAAAGIPIVAPSANLSGRITATTAADVAAELDGKVDLILDGGAAPLGIESSVVGFGSDGAVLLRAGAIPREAIEAVVGPLRKPGNGRISSPGQLESHYAPSTLLRLGARSVESGEALLAFGPNVPEGAVATRNLSVSGDLREAAANLFSMLRVLDAANPRSIAVMPVPDTGLGEAINDRLRRAAAPRGEMP